MVFDFFAGRAELHDLFRNPTGEHAYGANTLLTLLCAPWKQFKARKQHYYFNLVNILQ